MLKILTFLGTSVPRDRETKQPVITDYLHDGQVYRGYVFPQALRQFTTFDQMLVFTTEQAKTTTWPFLADLKDDRIQPVPIPLGSSTAEMWQIFDRILDLIDEGDTVIFDITHGLRSTPFLMFLFAAFLKFSRNVTIAAVYYGALELGNPRENIPAPVFDLSEFVDMLDWITAADRFISAGDGMSLTNLLREQMPPGFQLQKDAKAQKIGKSLRAASRSIENMSQALLMARPFEAMQSGAEVSNVLRTTGETISDTARPFEAIVGKVAASYGQFALVDPLDPAFTRANLTRQLAMAGWYLAHQQAVQATLLMREWLISAFMAVNAIYPLNDRRQREHIEDLFNASASILKNNKNAPTLISLKIPSLPNAYEVIKIWNDLTQLRNDIAHCGHRANAQSAESLIKRSNKIYAGQVSTDTADEEKIPQPALIKSSKILYAGLQQISEVIFPLIPLTISGED